MKSDERTIDQRVAALRKASHAVRSREWYHDRIDELEILLDEARDLLRSAPLHHFGKDYTVWKQRRATHFGRRVFR